MIYSKKIPSNSISLKVEEIGRWLTERLSEIVEIPLKQIDPNEDFFQYGLSPFNSVCLLGDLEKRLGRSLPLSVLEENPTVRLLSQYLVKESRRP